MISIVITIYKEPWVWIRESIQSILNQTFRDIQIILVVDNPNFEFSEELNDLLVGSKTRYKILNNKSNFGLVKSLNIGLKNSDGDYVARMDSDDVAEPDRFEMQMKFLTQNSLDFVSSNISKINERGEIYDVIKLNQSIYEKKLMKIERHQNIFWHPTWLARKQVYERLHGYRNIDFAEDYDFVIRALLNGFRLGQLKQPLVRKRINNNSISEVNALKQIVTANELAKGFRKKTIVSDNINEDIPDQKIKEFSQIKRLFVGRKSSSFSTRIKLWWLLLLTHTGHLFLKNVLIQKYQLHLMGLS